MAPNRPSVKYVPFEKLKDIITDNDLRRLVTHTVSKLPFEERDGVMHSNLSARYELLDQRCNVNDVVMNSAVKKIYNDLYHSVSAMTSARVIKFNDNGFLRRIGANDTRINGCLVLEGDGIVEYSKSGLIVPKRLERGDMFLWKPSVSLGMDEMQGATIVVYGMK